MSGNDIEQRLRDTHTYLSRSAAAVRSADLHQ